MLRPSKLDFVILVLIIIMGAYALSACQAKGDLPYHEPPSTPATQTPYIIIITATPAPSKREASVEYFNEVSPTPSDQIGTVVDVVDGDTIQVDLGGIVYRVRYIGVDAPEVQNQEWMGREAYEFNQALVLGEKVLLEKDVSETDQYDRLLRYVYLPDGTFVNAVLVEQGLAESVAYPPDTKFNAYFDELQAQAQEDLLGLWGVYQSLPDDPPIQITLVDKRAEYAVIHNNSTGTVDLSGWILRSERGNQDCYLRGTLLPGAELVIWSRAQDRGQGGYNCEFEENIWNNSELDSAVLIDNSNQLIDIYPHNP